MTTPNVTTVEGAIVAMLITASGVNSIVSGRIFPATDPQIVARPKLYYQRIDTTTEYSNDGPLGNKQCRLYLYSSADDSLTAKQLAIAVRTALDGYSGTASGIRIGCIRVTDESDDMMPLEPGQTKLPQRVRLELTIDYYQ